MTDRTHYVARIVVERIDHIEDSRNIQVKNPPERIKTELASIVVKSEVLDSLVSKTAAHLHLVESMPPDLGAPRQGMR